MRFKIDMDMQAVCRHGVLWLLLVAGPVVGEEMAALEAAVPAALDTMHSLSGTSGLPLHDTLLQQVYQQRAGEPIWYAGGKLNSRAERLMAAISEVAAEGLSPRDYVLPELDPAGLTPPQETKNPDEFLLTEIYLRLAHDLHSGQFKPQELDPYWHLPVDAFDPDEAMRQLLLQSEPNRLINALSPPYPGYQRLRQALQTYRQLASQGGWPALPEFPTLRPGEHAPEVPLLRHRLQLEGDHPDGEPTDATDYDDVLQASVRRFQRRNGLVEDGVVGAQTRAALNISVEERIEQIRANMERWRWLPRDLGDQYVLVNTAGFDLTLVLDGQPVLHQRTINGTHERQTPSFASRITHLVVNPKWTVPRLIAVKDLLPKQQRDAEFFKRMEIQVFQSEGGQWVQLDPLTINWRRYHKNYFPFMLRQAPGDHNSLGRIKFLMNNPYDIYLHDTPAKGLFQKPIRAFSSGCIRVQGVDQLARRLLQNGGQSPEETLDEPLHSLQTHIQRLARPVPVYLVYFTAWEDDEGLINFRPDIYQRNNDLVLALRGEATKFTASNTPDTVNSL